MSEIKPALTAEEWAAREVYNAGGFGADIDAEEDDAFRVLYDSAMGAGWADDVRHGLAALALHGQPYGFTWDDVELIRAALSVWDGMAMNDDGDFEYVSNRFDDRARGVADRIAALLPPREKP